MKKTIEFGKVDFDGNGKKECLVTIEMELKYSKKGPVFSAMGNVWDKKRYDIHWGGQCIADIWSEYRHQLSNKELYREIMGLWEKYHLNDMRAGTPKQQAEIKQWEKEGNRYEYKAACEHLTKVGLNPDGNYSYGSSWLYEAIPEADLNRIKEIMS